MPPIFFWSEDEKEAFQLMIDTLAKDINSLFDLIATLREGAAIPSESLPSRYQPFYKRVQCHKKRVLSGDFPPFSSQKMLLFFAPNWILFTFWKGGSAMNKRMVGSPKENINMLSLSLTILSIWDIDATYRVSQQVWDMLNVTFWCSENNASEASYVYKILTQ